MQKGVERAGRGGVGVVGSLVILERGGVGEDMRSQPFRSQPPGYEELFNDSGCARRQINSAVFDICTAPITGSYGRSSTPDSRDCLVCLEVIARWK